MILKPRSSEWGFFVPGSQESTRILPEILRSLTLHVENPYLTWVLALPWLIIDQN